MWFQNECDFFRFVFRSSLAILVCCFFFGVGVGRSSNWKILAWLLTILYAWNIFESISMGALSISISPVWRGHGRGIYICFRFHFARHNSIHISTENTSVNIREQWHLLNGADGCFMIYWGVWASWNGRTWLGGCIGADDINVSTYKWENVFFLGSRAYRGGKRVKCVECFELFSLACQCLLF